ncbi:hypothetical protein H2200_001627 [Cladophialophora chaetospira]|uniref:Uncharacterized protein n=1 Tax=Cladophialophora chaetospira TaxID=386627 RepID=A0AA38XL84_9EURO|nr:hypothetical protein H2200_001627 [Cladophialophora chaetospira]
MAPRSTWVERGADGRPYFVRKKPEAPSTGQILSQALLPKLGSARSLLASFRDSRQNRHVTDAETKNQRALPAPDASNPTPAATPQPTAPMAPAVPSSQARPQPMAMYLLAPPPNQNQDPKQSDSIQANAFQPLSPFIPAPPPPGMFPFPPHPLAAQPPNMFPPPMPFPPQYGPFAMPQPAPPQGSVLAPNQVHGTQVQPPNLHTATPAPADMRYKCEICGRYRSARYHYRHPIPPGQLPARTICRKCREEATDSESEESSTSDDYKASRSRRHQSRRPGRSQQHRSRSQAQHKSRGRNADRGYDRHGSPSYSDSGSLSSRRTPQTERRRYRRLESPASEVTRHTRRLRLSPLGERTYYERDGRHRDGDRIEAREHQQDLPRRARARSRAPTLGQRILRRQYSDPFVRTTRHDDPAISHLGHGDRAPQVHQARRYSPQRGPAPPWMGQTSMPVHASPDRYQQGFDGADREHRADRHGDHGPDMRSLSRSTQRARSVHRPTSHAYDDDSQWERFPMVAKAPSPPPARASSLGYMNHAESDDADYPEGCSRRGRHWRSRSQSWESEETEREILRAGDELTVIERHIPGHRDDDYDWYDDGGMRVTVREISR